MMKISVVGLGYVGLSNAVLLSQHNQVVGVDISKEKVDALNSGKVLVSDEEIEQFLSSNKSLDLRATTDLDAAIIGSQYVIIATPTNYDEEKNYSGQFS